MRVLVLLCCFVGLCLAADFLIVPDAVKDMRLIKFGEDKEIWMNVEDVEALKSECGVGEGFVDITEHRDWGKVKEDRIIENFPDTLRHQDEVNKLIQDINPDSILETITKQSKFYSRYYKDQDAVDSALDLMNSYKAVANNPDDVVLFPHSWAQPSFIARMEGSDDSVKDEIIVIGGHIDSISLFFSAPGADDDASGSAVVREIFRVLNANKFDNKRTIEFHGYAAEEVGLLGSAAIADAYAKNGIKVVAMMQLDMTGYDSKSGNDAPIALVTDYTDPSLNEFVRKLVTEYCSVSWVNTECGYGCSDHASWNSHGIPASFPHEATVDKSNPDIHTWRDTLDRISAKHMVEFAKLGIAFAVELSDAGF